MLVFYKQEVGLEFSLLMCPGTVSAVLPHLLMLSTLKLASPLGCHFSKLSAA